METFTRSKPKFKDFFFQIYLILVFRNYVRLRMSDGCKTGLLIKCRLANCQRRFPATSTRQWAAAGEKNVGYLYYYGHDVRDAAFVADIKGGGAGGHIQNHVQTLTPDDNRLQTDDNKMVQVSVETLYLLSCFVLVTAAGANPTGGNRERRSHSMLNSNSEQVK